MTRNRGKKALYEVMSKARVKPDNGKIVEHLRTEKPDEEALAARRKETAAVPKSTAKWWRKPRIVQLNAGRIEFSMPYQVAVVLVLVFIIVIIAAYRFGQSSYSAGRQETDQPALTVQESDGERPVERAMADIPQPSAPLEYTTPETEVAEPAKPAGNNVIVLVQYNSLADLAPVQAYFGEHGIELEIDLQQGSYFLQTIQRYDNPSRPGTDGYKALQKIKEVGKEYKAPTGYETFASKLFQDAYGKKAN